MLKRLYISNFALISEMEVHFPGGLTVITGETGAGKSIFLEALGLALGNRADLLAFKNAAKKCIVEAEFANVDKSLTPFFEELQQEFSNDIILRREISADGKTRSFLNDSPVTLQALKTLAGYLVDIHSQHQTLLLNQKDFQQQLVDTLGGSLEPYNEYLQNFNLWGQLKKERQQLEEQQENEHKEQDYLKFLFDELEEAKILPGTLMQLEEERAKLQNAGQIKGALLSAATQINSGETNVLGSLSQLKQLLNSISKFDPDYEQFYERINSVYIELKELAYDVENAGSRVEANQQKLEEINAKSDTINRLLNRHRVLTEEQLIQIKNDTEEKLHHYTSLSSSLKRVSGEIEKTKESCTKKALHLSGFRAKVRSSIEQEVGALLAGLSMPNARLEVKLNTLPQPGSQGLEEVELYFSANKGQSLSPINKTASGGELSRLMLCLKSLLAKKKKLPTVIFDEIDSGVSGETAHRTGGILANMGDNMQVICITHSPQIASKGSHHLFVYKTEESDKTVSNIRELNKEERVREIAKMLSAGEPGSSALTNARELLKVSQKENN